MNKSNLQREILNLLYIPGVILLIILVVKMLNWLPSVISELFLK